MITHKQFPDHHIFETDIGGRTFTVETGKVDVAGQRPKSSRAVRVGDTLRVRTADPARTLALLEHRAANLARARELAQRAYQTAASAGLREIEGRALGRVAIRRDRYHAWTVATSSPTPSATSSSAASPPCAPRPSP